MERVNQKVETVGSKLIPSEAVVCIKPILSVCLAGALGFAAGMAKNGGRTLGVLAIGVLIGFSGRRNFSQGGLRHE